MQKTFIAYDKNNFNILCFITNDYSTIYDAKEVFSGFENYEIVETNITVPNDFAKYKVVFDENGVFTGVEKLTQDEIYAIDPIQDGYNAAKILLGGEE
jgi:hypothetical protein